MTIQPEEFLAQGPSAFLNQPSFLEQGTLPVPKPKVENHIDFVKVALGIAAAVVVLRLLMKAEFSKIEPRTQEEINEASKRIYKRVFPAWMHASVPAIAQAYRLGVTEAVSYSELERMASDYAEELGDYINDSSILALTDGFNSQVNAGWSERLAWVRAREAYGLDTTQMRSYVKGLMARDKADYATDPIPASSRAMVDRLFLFRADRLGTNEAFKASQVGRNLVWLSLQSAGQIPDGTLKRWVTAEDERVCTVCGPLDQVAIPLHRRFESGGQFFYAPGVHPNCRCELEIVYPDDNLGINVVKKNMPGDPFNRNADGEFARKEQRKGLLAEKKGMLGRGLLAEGVLGEEKAEGKGHGGLLAREARGGLLEGAESKGGLLQSGTSAQGGLLAQAEREEFAAMLRESEALEAKLQAEAAAKKVKVRALTEGDVHSDVANAARRLDASKHRQKTIGFERARRPDDPGFNASTIYVPASNYMITRHLSPAYFQPGAEVNLGLPSQDGARMERLVGFHQPDEIDATDAAEWVSNPDGIYFELVNSDAFENAFDYFLELPDGGSLIRSENRMAVPVDDKAQADISDYRRFGNGIEARFIPARKALANMTRAELEGFALRVANESDDARMYFEPTEDIGEDDTASDIAIMILSAVQAESEENERYRAKTGNPRNDGAWNSSIYRLGENRGTHEQSEDEVLEQSRQLAMDVSEKRTITPVFFQIPGWYGITPSKPSPGPKRNTPEGRVSGRYVVVSSETVPLPADLADNPEVNEAIDGVTIVKLAYEPKRSGETDAGR